MKKHLIGKIICLVIGIVMVLCLASCTNPDPEPATYSVTFAMQGHGTAPATQTVEEGHYATKPATDPFEAGWTFGGWYKEAACTNEFVFTSEAITSDTTVYAKWTEATGEPDPQTYTVTFDMQGHGAAPAAQIIEKDGHATMPATAPTAEGWTFGGWYKEKACVNVFDFETETITSNTTVYAKWTEVVPVPLTYTVTFDMQGHGTAPAEQTIEKDGHATMPATAPTAEGWIFDGWYKEEACINVFDFETETITSDTTVYAKWTEEIPVPVTYTVTFDMQGHGTAPAVQTVQEGKNATNPEVPTASGWIFGGWYKEAACKNEFVFENEAITSDTTVYAKWTESKNLTENATPTIYLAGDSTVQGYGTAQYIAGWGQYLNLFLDSEVTVVNCARGGRSSRSFINEGRLFTGSYSFSENGGKSIEATIKAGDYLFVQFGHNDDDTKTLYSNLYDRMVPLGTPDSNGIYPTTAGKKVPTTYLPAEYTDNVSDTSAALKELAKYGSEYYSYDCGGTYKWYLKQYIDLAREKGAVPVLITPVARVSFNKDGTLKSGPGLHGENFAYVQAVRQLAKEEDCLLIDLFADTKDFFETATQEYASFLMAHVPNELTGIWPSGYDDAYNNSAVGWQKMEATHYNKYGAFISAAKVAEHILESYYAQETHKNDTEYYNFSARIKTEPTAYLDPSNLISKTKITAIEKLFKIVKVTNPDRTYPDPADVVAAIDTACTGTVTADNYLEYQESCEAVKSLYDKLNIDDRGEVTNYDKLLEYLNAIQSVAESLRDKPTRTVIFTAETLGVTSIAETITVNVKEKYGEGAEDQTPGTDTGVTVDFKIVGASGKAITVTDSKASFIYNGTTYSVSKYLSMGGSASFGSSRYIEFATTGACRIIVASMSTGNDDRTLNLVNANKTTEIIKGFKASGKGSGINVEYIDTDAAGTYKLGSAGSGIYVYGIIIEVIDHKHVWDPNYHYNGTHHWHVCKTCGEADEAAEHEFENGACNICGLADLTNTDQWDTVETEFNYASAVSQYGTTAAIPSDVTIGKFTVGAGAYFRTDNINTQGRNVTVTLGGVTNSISFEGNGQSSTKDTYFTLWNGNVEVTPEEWKTLSKDKKAYSVDNLEAGTYTIKTSAAGGIYNLKVTEVLEKSDPVSISVSGAMSEFLVNDEFTSKGLTVTLNHENGSKRIIDVNECTVESNQFDNTQNGKYTITVKYGSFSATYEVVVYSIEEIEIGTFISGGASKQTTLQTVYLPTANGTPDWTGLTVNATAKCGSETATFRLDSTQYSVSGYDLSKEGKYTVTVVANANSEATATFVIVVKSAKTVSNNEITVTVGKNGTEDFETVTEALQYISILNLADGVIKTINISDGEYYEKIFVDIPNVHFTGSDTKKPDATTDNGAVLWFDALAGKPDPAGNVYGTFGSGSVTVSEKATGFTARNITFKNYYNTDALYNESRQWLTDNGYKADTQAVALTVSADMASFFNCKMTSYHDTLLANNNRQFYKNCWIEGRTDYIFGNEAVAFFEDCDIYSIGANDAKNGGYVVAVRTGASQTYGFIFDNCRFDGDEKVIDGTVSLGRPWGADMKMIVMNSTISAKFSKGAYNASNPQGRYVPMSGANPKASNMLEYNNTGDGAINESIADTCTVLTDKAVADNYKDFTKIFAKNGSYWNPDAVTYTVIVYSEDGSEIGAIRVSAGDKITLAEVQELIADGTIDKVYTSSDKAQEFVFDTAIETDTELYVVLKNIIVYTQSATISFSDYGTDGMGDIQGTTGAYKGIEIDATASGAKFGSFTNGQINIGVNTVLKVYVTPDAEVEVSTTLHSYSEVATAVSADYQYLSEGYVLLTCTSAGWISAVTVTYGITTITENTVIDLTDNPTQYQGNTGTYKNVEIDATSGKLGQSNGSWCQFNIGTVLTVKVAEDAIVTATLYTNGECTISERNAETGKVTITANNDTYISRITVTFGIKTITESTVIDLTDNPTQYQGNTGTYKNVEIDATSGKLGVGNGSWCQFNSGTVLTVKVAEGATVTATLYANGECTISERNAETGKVTITANNNTYISRITVTFGIKTITESTVIDLTDNPTQYQGNTGTYKNVEIDATSGKLGQSNGSWCQFNSGTVLTVKVAEGATVTATLYTNGECTISERNAETGEVTITANNNTYISKITVTIA